MPPGGGPGKTQDTLSAGPGVTPVARQMEVWASLLRLPPRDQPQISKRRRTNNLKCYHKKTIVVKSSFFELRTILTLKSFLKPSDLERVEHAFGTKLNYWYDTKGTKTLHPQE